MLKDIYFGVQGALLFLAGCGAYDLWYKGTLPGVHAIVIILACVMALYSSFVLYLRTEKKH